MPDKTSRRIAWEAARLLRAGSEKDWQQARIKATRRLVRGRLPSDRLPGEDSIRDALLALCGEAPRGPDAAGRVPDVDRHSRLQRFESWLRPLETVRMPRECHPEGDALYHSLQVFELVRDEAPYDEELLIAGLLHEVGRAEDRDDPVAATVAMLGDRVTERTRWLITHHAAIVTQFDGSISARKRRGFRRHPWYEDLVTLADADRDGRQVGVAVPDEREALRYIDSLAAFDADDPAEAPFDG